MKRARGLSHILLVVAMSGACLGQTLYVDAADGNDSDVGLRPESALATIQAAINSADEGDTVIVSPGRYEEDVNFLGKNITLRSTRPSNSGVVRSTTIVGTVCFRGTEQAHCTLRGFNIDGYIIGYDWQIDPTGENHSHAGISHCILENIVTHCGGVIEACDGIISNCVIANISYSCRRAWSAAAITNCRGVIQNCTMVNMRGGIEIRSDETLTIHNCIIYRSPLLISGTAVMSISYMFFGTGVLSRGPGNVDSDPCFADPDGNDYHLKSQGGRWDLHSETWVIDDVTSPCIDAGDPMSPVGLEPFPNGGIVNLGAYAGTAEASKSYFGGSDCFPNTPEYEAQYAQWVALGKPDCWCNDYGVAGATGNQCYGDAGGDVPSKGFIVFTTDLDRMADSWKAKLGDSHLDPCADMDHKGYSRGYRVYTGDLAILATNWRKVSLPGDCPITDLEMGL